MCVAASTDTQVQMLHVQEWRDNVFSRPHSVEFAMLLIMSLGCLKGTLRHSTVLQKSLKNLDSAFRWYLA